MILQYATVLFYIFCMYFLWHTSIRLENNVNKKKAPDIELCYLLYEYMKSKETFQNRTLNSA